MPEKQRPVGICDLCGGPIPPGQWYTKRGPRLHCSLDCRNTANSRAGAPIRADKARQRVERGEWVSPRALMTPEEISRVNSIAARKGRRREIEEGRWRSPAMAPEARQKLSRPRKHGDNPALHSALEKFKQGLTIADMTPEEQEAHRVYRRQLEAKRRDKIRAYHHRRYHEQMATEEGRAAARQRWQREREQLKQREPNARLVAARQAAGLSQAGLAQRLGVSQGAVSQWERYSAIPRDGELRRQVEELLGQVWEG